jgi:hypothetical protein
MTRIGGIARFSAQGGRILHRHAGKTPPIGGSCAVIGAGLLVLVQARSAAVIVGNWLRCTGEKGKAPFEYWLERRAAFLSVKTLPARDLGAMVGDFTMALFDLSPRLSFIASPGCLGPCARGRISPRPYSSDREFLPWMMMTPTSPDAKNRVPGD